jgi:outer membrane biosynthesis protein TonB
MPITQIPFQDPVAPPEKPQPEQLGLYDQQDWEAAYRELDARVPHLIIQLQDDLQRSRKREAVWLSIILHLVVFIALWNLPLIQKTLGWHRVAVVPVNALQDKNVTFLPLPPDLQKPAHRPNTNIASDKDRIAMTRHPELDRKDLQKILPSPPPGSPGLRGPRGAQASPPPQQSIAQNQMPQQQMQQAQPTQRPQFQSNQTAQLQTPPQANNSFSKYMGPMSAGSAIQQATQAAADRRASGGGGDEGDFGLNRGAHGRQMGNLEILSDTQGVDFGPYLQRILQDIKDNWYRAIPESALMGKKGKLSIRFLIAKNGKASFVTLDGHTYEMPEVEFSSGDDALDRAAEAGIQASNPFPPLPGQFTGPYLDLRIRFYYNPDAADLQ